MNYSNNQRSRSFNDFCPGCLRFSIFIFSKCAWLIETKLHVKPLWNGGIYKYQRSRPFFTVVLNASDSVFLSSPLKLLGWMKPNYIWSLCWVGEWKFAHGIWVTWSRWPYTVKSFVKPFQESNGQWPWNLICTHWVRGLNQVCSNGDPWLTLTYLTARSNLVS